MHKPLQGHPYQCSVRLLALKIHHSFAVHFLPVNIRRIVDWDDVVFEVDLLKSQEINLDYILELIFEHNKITLSGILI
jgi:type I site-specific restriction-modification system R (restriction) subunit